ncbi:MAG: PEP-utilizing enzyme, partial [Acidimicrobiales bacterium]
LRGPNAVAARSTAAPALRGRPCAPGRAVGRVGVPSGIAVVEHLTTADYGIVFGHAGVVMEQDASPLSHIALLCRELGVPFVCGVDGARARLVGCGVAVDGSAGEIAIVPDAEEAVTTSRPPAVAPTMSSLELVVRLLAEGRPGHEPAGEAERIVRRYGRSLGGGAVRVTGTSLALDDAQRLERLGVALFGPEFSIAAVLAGCKIPSEKPDR